ncbi:hypothetical protein [Burkholderia pseudomallei]|uniref:hypothetical protein n=1 Tax=Burkholderia pseudomallei TaxID=28450 RepID=UPI0011C4D82E|nr:hypothetical protein [Burkholderia pseudomallei]
MSRFHEDITFLAGLFSRRTYSRVPSPTRGKTVMLRNFLRHALACSIVAVLGLPGLTMATEPASTGLGQAWPNATDVSLSPHYHVYVFTQDGIRYIQINDANGVVRGAIATADGVILVLPLGVDAARIKTMHVTPGSATPSTSTGSTETVYRDQTTTVSVTPQTSSALQITTQQAAICSDPGECSNNGP